MLLNRKKTLHHKYLNDIGVSSTDMSVFNSYDTIGYPLGILNRYKRQRAEHGFDEREVYNLDVTMCMWLYAHLRMLLEHKKSKIDDAAFEIPLLKDAPEDWQYGDKPVYHIEYKQAMNEEQCFNMAVYYLSEAIKMFMHIGEDETADHFKETVCFYDYARCALKIITVILPCLWE